MGSKRVWALLAVAACALLSIGAAAAAATAVVTPATAGASGWDQTDIRGAGSVLWSDAFGAPNDLGTGALRLSTGAENADKAFIATDDVAGTALTSVYNLSYWTYRASGPAVAAASLQLVVDTGASGCTSGQSTWTTLVYEPYWNGTVGAGWEQWSMTPSTGVFWSSKTTCGGNLVAGAGGPPLYTLSDVTTAYPGASLLALGVNVGTFNPGYDVGVDGVAIGDTTYDFEPDQLLGDCAVADDGSTITLLADCTTDETIVLPDGYTLDGDGHTITAVDPAGGHFMGAIVKNGGSVAHVTDVGITVSDLADTCDAGDARLRGILFDGAGGSITNTTVTGVNQGESGCQEGNGIEVRNAPFDPPFESPYASVTIADNVVTDYQKNGITTNGSVSATITGNTVTGAGPVDYVGQNGIQVGFGASARIEGNAVSGNDYTPEDTVACGLLFFEANGVKQKRNDLFANEQNVCNFGRGGGHVNAQD